MNLVNQSNDLYTGDRVVAGTAGSGGAGGTTVGRGGSVDGTSGHSGLAGSANSPYTHNLGATASNSVTGGNDSLIGTAGSDSLGGAAGNDQLQGLAGNDILTGGAGNDRLDGGLGIDRVFETFSANCTLANTSLVGNGTDTLIGIEQAWLVGGAGNNTLNAVAFTLGETLLDGGAGNDLLTGGAGSDSLLGGSGDDTINGGAGSDALAGEAGNDVLAGGAGNDRLLGGSGDDTLNGGVGNDTLVGEAGSDRLAGSVGDDTYLVDNATADQVLEAVGEGTDTVQSSVTYALASNVENLTLTGTAVINATGNTLANALTGNAAANILNGGAGIDTLRGGAGNDTYVVDSGADSVVEAAGQGTDTVQSSATYALANNVENLTLTGTAAINATGNSIANTLTGNAAANVLNGGAGIDTLQGGAGNDTYVVDNTADRVVEAAGQGTDSVQSSATYTLAVNVENLTLTGMAAINATGNTLANTLTGNAAGNVLNGGAGIDTLQGGVGNDTYVVDNSADSVVEAAGQGTDTVQSSFSCVLAANVENLTLTGTLAINGTGNDLANTLTGNAAANTLAGGLGNDLLNGGAGADILQGGAGDDRYVVDNAGDQVVENVGEGNDTVLTAFTYALVNNVENLTLTGTAAINATGNTLANTLTGNSANNILNGGSGEDILKGGVGNDTYVVDNAADKVVENSGAGTDAVQSSVTYTLAANIEKLTLTGSAAINGTGNGLANTLTGNSATNILSGGAGDDTYVMNNIVDRVQEYVGEGTDTVQSSVSYVLAANVENLTLTGTAAINGTGNVLANVLTGNTAANILTGGAGDDTYVVDNVGDRVVENSGGGSDTVLSSIGYALVPNTENLVLTGTAAIDGTGNALANSLTGNAAANVLDGGVGADLLRGGEGADTFVIGSIAGGTDRVLDFQQGVDRLLIKSGADGFNIGNGDQVINQGTVKTVHDWLMGYEELVIFTENISGTITAEKAAALIYDVWYSSSYGDQLFVFDNGADSAIFEYHSLGLSGVDPSELTLIATLQGTAQTGLADYFFG
ncbi:MAG: calcium-binding protein [Candidatus Accumulibacter propinquus]|jgi:Ca2+-binding RTX toxin-like protein|uniref:beta strand repeat-containing protein n=1 Tax=Candidatus Accumulibacter propinquus TaxID=2954380 RepID=UPI002FC3A6A2